MTYDYAITTAQQYARLTGFDQHLVVVEQENDYVVIDDRDFMAGAYGQDVIDRIAISVEGYRHGTY